MKKLRRFRALVLTLTALCASAVAATEGQRTFRQTIPAEAAGLYDDLAALKFDSTASRVSPTSTNHRWRVWNSHATNHFVILTDAPADWATKAGRTLERTQDAFYRAFGSAGFEPAPMENRLVWVAFSRRDDFHQYALNIDRLDMSWSDGYYSTRTNRVALVCESAAPARSTVASASDSTEHFPQPSEGFTHLAQATHEAVHQLAFNSGLQKRGVMYPLWASEGLATNFEASGSGEFGPTHDNAHRRRQIVRAMQRDQLITLHDFITLTRVPVDSPDQTHSVYAQSWAFFRFLFNHRPRQLRQYMSDLAALEPGRRDTATLRREFTRAFGRIDALDRSWQAYLRLLEMPEGQP